ncbi:MAG TPA: DUF6600 domain-containing protein [Rhizomicrobium sp.]|nr:DUF6600 domain-containing protein [Rhizomicrobium sp.]
MHRFVRGLLFASMAPLLAIPPSILMPAAAQAQPFDISFDSFHDQLGNYGDWLYSDRWGEVWRPWQQDRDAAWRPYSVGHWVYTDEYGWTWISDEGPWGDIAYHYGRWVFDPDDGWLWLSGYVWSPAWVVWRSAGPNVGWMPMPPDDAFLGNGDLSVHVSFGDWDDIGGYYGYVRWYGPRFDENRFGSLWTFVPSVHVADPAYRNYVVPRPQVVNIVRVSRNITNYTVINNVIINKSVNINLVRGAGGRPLAPVHANAVLHTTRWVMPVNRGQQIQARMHQLHPRGNGLAGSAPRPTPQQVGGLSTRPIPAHGPAAGGAHHLFNQANAAQVQGRRPGGAALDNMPGRPAAPAPNNPGFQGPAGAPRQAPPRENRMQPEAARPNFQAQPPGRQPPRSHETRQAPLDRGPIPPPANRPVPAAHDDMRAMRQPQEKAIRPPRPEPQRQPPPRSAPHPQASHAPRPEHHDEGHRQDH